MVIYLFHIFCFIFGLSIGFIQNKKNKINKGEIKNGKLCKCAKRYSKN